MGKIASKVKSAINGYCNGELDDEEFKEQIHDIFHSHPNPGNIGRALQAHRSSPWISDQDRADKALHLANNANPRIGEHYENWTDVYCPDEDSISNR